MIIDFANFKSSYAPIKNPNTEGFLYSEVEQHMSKKHLWTVLEEDEFNIIVPNVYNNDNVVGYLFTEVAWENEDLEALFETHTLSLREAAKICYRFIGQLPNALPFEVRVSDLERFIESYASEDKKIAIPALKKVLIIYLENILGVPHDFYEDDVNTFVIKEP